MAEMETDKKVLSFHRLPQIISHCRFAQAEAAYTRNAKSCCRTEKTFDSATAPDLFC